MLLSAERSLLLVVDIQDRLMPSIHQGERVVAKTTALMGAAAELAVPVMITEQYPKGLGHTAPVLLEAGGYELFEKITFSAARTPEVSDRLAVLGRDQIVICGAEAHVCVQQTAIDLKLSGYEVYVVADAISSREAENARLATERMRALGLQIVSTEMVIFEWLERAGTPTFKSVLPLIK